MADRALLFNIPFPITNSVALIVVLSRPDLGHLGKTAQPEASVIRLTPGTVDLADVTGEIVRHDSLLTPVGPLWKNRYQALTIWTVPSLQ